MNTGNHQYTDVIQIGTVVEQQNRKNITHLTLLYSKHQQLYEKILLRPKKGGKVLQTFHGNITKCALIEAHDDFRS